MQFNMIKIVIYNKTIEYYIMKKTLLFAGTLLFSLFTQAQNFHLEDANDPTEIYQSGDFVEVGELGDLATESGFFSFKVRNNSENTINVQAKLVEVLNGEPEALQFCFSADCYTNIVIDRVYPTDNQFAAILPGETHKETDFDHIANFYEPENGNPAEYTFEFFEINDEFEAIGTPLLITYRYNPTLSTPDFNANFALLKSTVLKESIDINLDEDANLSMYDMLGRQILNKNLTSGAHHIALPNLSSNMYFIQVNNKDGAQQTFKVIVK